MSVDLVPVDPHDAAAFAPWFAVLDACLEHDRPGEPHWGEEEQRVLAVGVVEGDMGRTGTLLAAVEGGRVVGAARAERFTLDNPHLCRVVVCVHPGARRRGTGTALLEACRAWAREHGRTVLSGEVDEVGPDAPGRRFAERAGAELGLRETRRRLDLPPDPARVAALRAEARERAAGYALVTWRDAVPAHLLEDRAAMEARMSTDAPTGDLPWELEQWDGARFREHEALQARMGRTVLSAGAVRDGRLVAFTDLGLPRGDPRLAYQWGTLVEPAHRGHRLGALVKTAALEGLVAAAPECRAVVTWNAETNAPMVRVNEALGFVVDGMLSSWSLTA